ncbi:MAG: hypothetical protein EOO27_22470 [Comamonadaceae bacterium]|nr:MAG: hypothetical protein EOO27_22470 [Comamonadaceae bacterium]
MMRDLVGAVPSQAEAAMASAWACEQSILRFTAALDRGDSDEMKRYFRVDGTWRGGPVGTVRGHSGIDELLTSREPDTVMRHVITNTRTTELLGGEMLAESYVTVYLFTAHAAVDLRPTAIGRYLDRLSLNAGTWIINDRQVLVDIT